MTPAPARFASHPMTRCRRLSSASWSRLAWPRTTARRRTPRKREASGRQPSDRRRPMRDSTLDRRTFLGAAAVAGVTGAATGADPKKVKVGVIGCGSVSHSYLPHLSKSPHVELVSTCDRIPERAKAQAEKFKVPNHY